MLRFAVEEIPESGLAVEHHLDPEWMVPLLGPQFSPMADGLFVRADLARSGRLVVARGHLLGKAVFQCSRCLSETPWHIEVSFTHLFVEEEVHGQRIPDGFDEGDELESSRYQDGTVDLEPLLAEELVLSLPQAPLCSQECLGLCQRCGKNLNEGSCGCPPEGEDPRWAPLKRIH